MYFSEGTLEGVLIRDKYKVFLTSETQSKKKKRIIITKQEQKKERKKVRGKEKEKRTGGDT